MHGGSMAPDSIGNSHARGETATGDDKGNFYKLSYRAVAIPEMFKDKNEKGTEDQWLHLTPRHANLFTSIAQDFTSWCLHRLPMPTHCDQTRR